MLKRLTRIFSGDPVKKTIEKYLDVVQAVNALEDRYEQLSDEELRAQTDAFRRRLARGETLDDLLPEAFAVVREASKRTIGLRHYDVQIIGGTVLHRGAIAEMRTGEGKTLVATMPLYLNALALNPAWVEKARRRFGDDPDRWEFRPLDGVPVGRGAHLVTVNDYLARRDARWMAPIYDLLGLSVGVLQMAARTENGKKAFLVDLERSSPHEDQHQLRMVPRREAYAADITYGTNNEFGFDYLRDNMTYRLEDRVQRGHHFAIIDEVDNVLIDEARTPLIISGPASESTEWYQRMAQIVKQLRPEDYEINERDRTVTLTEVGETHVEELLGMPLRDPERPEDITPEQAQILGYLEQALRAQFLFKRNKDYLVQAGKVIIVDEFTGRLMPGRRWSDGLHQAVEAKEGVPVQAENVTYATITIQNYFRMYEKLSGMTGTAATEAEEFHEIYNLEVEVIPTNLDYQAYGPNAPLVTLEDTDEEGYRYTYYARRDDPEKKPIFYKRKDYPDVVFRTEEAKFRAIIWEILRLHVLGRPILVGTTSVALSERLSARLRADMVQRLALVNLLRALWLEQHGIEEDGRARPELEPLYAPLHKLPRDVLRKMARELGVPANPASRENLPRLLDLLRLPPESADRLLQALQGGIPHQVLNARKHTEESQIIAGAGAFGAVTIATNMAGRGVDIKLGGELAEEVIAITSRVLRRAGHPDPYNLSLEERRAALLALDPADYGIYETEVQFFLRYMEDMERVKELGGLHVIGSERHESRRIDNQLRGRAARQGDPGSSRFYLSLQDDLMRLFGGEQVDNMMKRLKVDDAVPLEHGLVNRIIEQAQTRVEGANFDTRKHLLEYDDVLNTQRATIYAQRDRIFVKDDLTEDVNEMLRTELQQRVPQALEDEEGPWRLLAFLEQIQPAIGLNEHIYPSYPMEVLLRDLLADGPLPKAQARQAVLDLARDAIQAEADHVLRSVNRLLDSTIDQFEAQLNERLDALDTFLEGLELEDETDHRSPQQLGEELNAALGMTIKLPPSQLRALRDDPDEAYEVVREQVERTLAAIHFARLMGAVQRRLEEPVAIQVQAGQLSLDAWNELGDLLLDVVQQTFDRRIERYIGSNGDGAIAQDVDNLLKSMPEMLDRQHLIRLLVQMPQGARATFDKKTHRRVWMRTTRLTYVYLAAHALEDQTPEAITEDVLEHLEGAQQAIQDAYGEEEWGRMKGTSLAQVYDATLPRVIASLVGEETVEQWRNHPLSEWPEEMHPDLREALGRWRMTHNYRQLLLGVISQLWVDYLTRMEALRVSIGLEAYGQRDPLVQYKAKSYELFQQLLSDIRMGVVSRMFTYRTQMSTPRVEAPRAVTAAQAEGQSKGKGKGKRRRRRKKR